MHKAADRIRNVALVGHRGSGKTSLFEALLFQAGATNRLGSVADGTSLSDAEPDEQARGMSIGAALNSFEWQDRSINLLDTPGEPSFVADALGALRVCESAVFVVNAVMGVEVSTVRLWERAAELDLARMVFVNMLDRERADFFRTLESLKARVRPARRRDRDPDRRRARGPRRDRPRRHEGLRVRRRPAATTAARSRSPTSSGAQAEEYREKLMDEVAEVSEALMERYLEGEEISHEEIVAALKDGTNHGGIFPVVCGVATRNLGTNRLLDAIVEDLPVAGQARRAGGRRRSRSSPTRTSELFAYVFKTRADPFAGRINLFRVYQGVMRHDSARAQHARARQGADRPAARASGQGDRARRRVRPRRHRRGRQAQGDARRRLARRARRADLDAGDQAAGAGHGVRDGAQAKGDEDKVFTALRRLQEEDPTIDLHRDPQTGEQIVAGPVADPRRGDRRPAEVALRRRGRRSSRRACPTRRRSAGRPRRTGATRSRPAAAASSATATSRSSRCARATGLRVRRRDQGRRDPAGLHPGGREGRPRGDGARPDRRLSRSRACACGSSTAATTRSTRPSRRSRSPARSR